MNFWDRIFKKKTNGSCAIGIIGAADGPTGIFVASVPKKTRQENEAFLADAAERIKPCRRTMEQLEEHLLEHYQAVPCDLSEGSLRSIKANVILNSFPEVINKPSPLSDNPTRAELQEYCRQDTSFLQALNYPAEKLGLDFRTYLLPNEKPDIPKPGRRWFQRRNEASLSDKQADAILKMEMTTQYLCGQNVSEVLMDELLLWQGVSEQDIRERTPRFIAYAYAMKNKGRL
ncbi:MAG TPA: hypothetical protein VN441_13330 [Syntrophomonas sp.]|nr:hypothetical protein [Syntrophomonas sp.]